MMIYCLTHGKMWDPGAGDKTREPSWQPLNMRLFAIAASYAARGGIIHEERPCDLCNATHLLVGCKTHNYFLNPRTGAWAFFTDEAIEIMRDDFLSQGLRLGMESRQCAVCTESGDGIARAKEAEFDVKTDEGPLSAYMVDYTLIGCEKHDYFFNPRTNIWAFFSRHAREALQDDFSSQGKDLLILSRPCIICGAIGYHARKTGILPKDKVA